MQIRQAEIRDLDEIVAMSRAFYETTSYRGFAAFDADTVSGLAAGLIDHHVMLVAEADDALIGMVGLLVAPFMFNGNVLAAYEVVWYVAPDAQGRGAGKALLAAIEPACRERGCAAIQMVHLANSPPQAAAIYERMGFVRTESSYTKEL